MILIYRTLRKQVVPLRTSVSVLAVIVVVKTESTVKIAVMM